MIDMEKAVEIINLLKKEYKNWNAPAIELMAQNGSDPFKILVSTVLSLRTKDEVTLKASERLFSVVSNPEELAKLPEEEIQKLIYPVGFYRNKAKVLKEMSKTIIEKFNGKVPDNIDELLSIKGVGRKTANLVLSAGYGKPAICVDTHVHRISNRLGLLKTTHPEETEFELMKIFPQYLWSDINKIFVAFGQTICKPVKPRCKECSISNYCEVKNGNLQRR